MVSRLGLSMLGDPEEEERRRRLDPIAKAMAGNDVSVADPARFEAFLQQNFTAFSGQQSAQSTPATVPSDGFDLGGLLARAFRRPEPPPDAGLLDRLLPGFRQVFESPIPESAVEFLPERVQPAGRAARELTSPGSLALLPIGGPIVAALGSAGFVGGSQIGAELGGPTGEMIGGIGGGFLGPSVPSLSRAAVTGTKRLAQSSADLAAGMGRANVGNVLLPRAPARVGAPLIYEGLTPAERRLLQQTGLRPSEMGDLEGARDLIYGPVEPATGARTGNIVSANDAAAIRQLEQDIGETQMRRQSITDLTAGAQKGGLRDLYDSGLLRAIEQSEKDPTTVRWHGKGLDEVFQSLPEAEQNALPRFDAGRELNEAERLTTGLQQIRTTGAGASTRDITRLRHEIDVILSKYAPEETPAGPITQAGFGGEMGPGQVARGAAEQPRMTQVPLSEVAASEADRIAKARAAQVVPPSAGVVAPARGRSTIPVFVRATEADRPAAQAFIDDLVTRAGDRTGSVGLQDLVPQGLDDAGIQDVALKLRTADALGIRAASDGRPVSFLLASRPGQITAQQYRRGAAATVDTGASGQGRQTYIGFNIGARPMPAQGLPPVSAPAAATELPAGQAAKAATDIPQSSTDAAVQLEREVAAARTRLPQSSAEAALEREVAAARGGLPPRGPQAAGAAGTPEPDRVETVIGKITQLLRAAPAARQITAAERRAAIGRGAAIGRERAAPLEDPLSRTRAFISGQSGQTTSQARFEPLGIRVPGPEGAGELARLTPSESARALGVTTDDFTALHRRIAERLPDEFTSKDGQIALVRLLTGNVPTERGQRLLQEVFGPEFVAAVRKQRSALSRGIEFGFDLIGLLPKAVRSSWDASAPLRQGVIFTLNYRPSRIKAARESFVLMFRAGFSKRGEEIATQSFMDIRDPARNRWAAELYSPGAPKRLFLHDPRRGMALSDKEEFYASRLVESLPELGKDLNPILRVATTPIRVFGKGIRRSELMYGTYLNELRNKIAVRTLDEWERSGRALQAADVDELIDGINVFTGRGNLGSMGERIAKPLTAAFWSPRLAVSRPQSAIVALRGMTVDQILRSAPGARARRELAKDMVAFVTTGVTILGALKAFNVADVEVDPRSTDFGKVRVGNIRFDFWGGFQSTARFVAQVVPAQTKVLTGKQAGKIRQGTPHIGASGRIVKGDPFAKREVITMRFLRGKLAPGLPTLFWNEFTSETFLGERLNEPSGLIGTTTGPTVNVRTREVFEQFVPLLAVDLIEAYEESGAGGVFYSTVPGALGVGVQTFGERESPTQSQTIPGLLR